MEVNWCSNYKDGLAVGSSLVLSLEQSLAIIILYYIIWIYPTTGANECWLFDSSQELTAKPLLISLICCDSVRLVRQCVLRFVDIVDARTFGCHQRVVTNSRMWNRTLKRIKRESTKHATVCNNALMTSESTRINDMYES